VFFICSPHLKNPTNFPIRASSSRSSYSGLFSFPINTLLTKMVFLNGFSVLNNDRVSVFELEFEWFFSSLYSDLYANKNQQNANPAQAQTQLLYSDEIMCCCSF
jgi:hypothetical protein